MKDLFGEDNAPLRLLDDPEVSYCIFFFKFVRHFLKTIYKVNWIRQTFINIISLI